ncbi:MAG: hypothetical protein GC155_14825 [Alphaproteobacteria bacterium]|nr:hypothetical protein [Alphaproteobacteria bacterium]
MSPRKFFNNSALACVILLALVTDPGGPGPGSPGRSTPSPIQTVALGAPTPALAAFTPDRGQSAII